MNNLGCLFSLGSENLSISDKEMYSAIISVLEKLGERKRVLAIPPDATRNHAHIGILLKAIYDFYGSKLTAVLPALGTHRKMNKKEIQEMYSALPIDLLRWHNWKEDIVTLGEVPASFVEEHTNGLCHFSWPAQVNRLLVEGGFDLIISLGQVVPHEVIGMSNYTKNLVVGVGGKEGIDRSHWIGAAYGIEKIIGRTNNPVRDVFNYAEEHFISKIPILYAMTVVNDKVRGLFIGNGQDVFLQAAKLSQKVNIIYLEKPAKKIVVWLDPEVFHSTWLGNKAIYRTRLAISDGGTIEVIAPGVDTFGEDPEINDIIRDYGYCGTKNIIELVDSGELASDMAAAAHLAHGSSDGRFNIIYATSGISKKDIESVGYIWEDYQTVQNKYNPEKLQDGWNNVNGEEIFFVRNPALGLWATKDKIGA